MLTDDLYTYEKKSKYQGGSPHCRLCTEPGQNVNNIEDLVHILTICKAYQDIRIRILFQMEILCQRSRNKIQFGIIVKNPTKLTQFILDCTSINLENRISEIDEICPLVFNLSRDLCYSIIKKRNNLIKQM